MQVISGLERVPTKGLIGFFGNSKLALRAS